MKDTHPGGAVAHPDPAPRVNCGLVHKSWLPPGTKNWMVFGTPPYLIDFGASLSKVKQIGFCKLKTWVLVPVQLALAKPVTVAAMAPEAERTAAVSKATFSCMMMVIRFL